MADKVPTNVSALIATVTQATANIARHRQAMADVAAQIRGDGKPPATTEGGAK